jgi:hypothetical protein
MHTPIQVSLAHLEMFFFIVACLEIAIYSVYTHWRARLFAFIIYLNNPDHSLHHKMIPFLGPSQTCARMHAYFMGLFFFLLSFIGLVRCIVKNSSVTPGLDDCLSRHFISNESLCHDDFLNGVDEIGKSSSCYAKKDSLRLSFPCLSRDRLAHFFKLTRDNELHSLSCIIF